MKKPFKLSDLLGKTPAPIQTNLLSAKEFEIGMITGFAAGKTRGICAAALYHAVKYPKAKILLGRKTFAETVNTVKQPFFIMADELQKAGWFVKPMKWDYKEGTNHARLVNGSQFIFGNLDDPIKYRNEEFSMIVVDQAEEISEEMWDMLTGRVRWPLVPAEGYQAIAAANDAGHNWVWRHFVDDVAKHNANPNRCKLNPFCIFMDEHRDEDGVAHPERVCATRRFFHGTTLDNAHNLAPRYLASLLAHDTNWQKHFIYATMEAGSGRLLLDPKIVKPFEPPSSWPRYRAIDHALNSPCCCLWIAVNNGSAEYMGVPINAPYVYREYWGTYSSIDQHAARILRLSGGENILATVIDRSAYHTTQSTKEGGLKSAADLYGESNLWTVPSVGDPFARVERINSMVHRGMAISETCQNTIRQIPEYYAEQNPDGEAKIVNKSIFHGIDALGYGLMIIPMDSRDETFVEPGRPSFAPDVDPLTRAHHTREFERLKRIQDAHEENTRRDGMSMIKSDEFWGESSVTPAWLENV